MNTMGVYPCTLSWTLKLDSNLASDGSPCSLDMVDKCHPIVTGSHWEMALPSAQNAKTLKEGELLKVFLLKLVAFYLWLVKKTKHVVVGNARHVPMLAFHGDSFSGVQKWRRHQSIR